MRTYNIIYYYKMYFDIGIPANGRAEKKLIVVVGDTVPHGLRLYLNIHDVLLRVND